MPRCLPAPLGMRLPLLLTMLIAACCIEFTAAAPHANAASPLAGGRATCTIVGVPGRAIFGTAGDDVICGTDRGDVIFGRGGNDTVYAGNGNDAITTGAGSDVIDGGAGIDRINTGDGNDTIDGGGDGDFINGGAGSDTIHGEHSAGATALQSSGTATSTITICHWAGNAAGTVGRFLEMAIDEKALAAHTAHAQDLAPAPISGCPESGNIDVIDGGAGDDTIDGDSGGDRITGGDGNDTIRGGDGNDTERGGNGNDTEQGDGGEDHLYGDAGDDALSGGDGHDTVDGGTGSNSCHTTGSDADDTFTLSCGDHEAPTLEILSVAPASVDTSAGAQNVDVTVHVTDAQSGIDHFWFQFVGPITPTGAQSVGSQCWSPPGAPDNLRCVGTGTKTDATYTVHMTIPKSSAAGTWTLSNADAVDGVGNQRHYVVPATHKPVTFAQTGVGDTAKPVFASATLSATSISTQNGPASVRMRMHITDDVSGFERGYVNFCPRRLGPNPGASSLLFYQGASVNFYPWSRVAGTPTDGDYEISVELPRYAPADTYDLCSVAIFDSAGNSYLSGFGTPPINLSFTQTDAGDTTPPVVQSVNLSSPTINTKDGSQTVVVTMHITDNLAGVNTARSVLRPAVPSGWVFNTFYSTLTRTSGTALDGTYTATLVFPKLAPCGIWNFKMDLLDQAMNVQAVGAGTTSGAIPPITNDYATTPVV